MSKPSWHFPRMQLAKQVIGMFESGLSVALVFFAPRRMGKTEFLLKDIQPIAEKEGWWVFYHSFLDSNKNAEAEFTKALQQVLKQSNHKVKKISVGAMGIQGSLELQEQKNHDVDFRELLKNIGKQHKVLLLLDEIQALAKDEANLSFVTSLRTVLDTNKESINVIFTGSSREGLKKMFSVKDAPFFHFGQNLSFPQFGPEFTVHLAKKYAEITQKKLNETILWAAFEELGKMPQLIRSLVERMVLHPELSIQQAKKELLKELTEDRSFEVDWDNYSALEQYLLVEIALKNHKLYSVEVRRKIATKLGLADIPVSAVQSALRKLNKNIIIGRASDCSGYFIDDPNFQEWILQK